MNEQRDSSDRLTIDFQRIEINMYQKITTELTSKFNLEASGAQTVGVDEIFQSFKKGDDLIGLEWDNWSGYIVTAKTKSAEQLVREIAGYINANFYS